MEEVRALLWEAYHKQDHLETSTLGISGTELPSAQDNSDVITANSGVCIQTPLAPSWLMTLTSQPSFLGC